MTESKKVIYTGSIPQCPYCEKPTQRTSNGGMRTLVYFPPRYDENGNNTNPDRNTQTNGYFCYRCDKAFTVVGNHTDGFEYKML